MSGAGERSEPRTPSEWGEAQARSARPRATAARDKHCWNLPSIRGACTKGASRHHGAALLLGAGALVGVSASAMGCGEGLAGATQRVAGARYEVAFAPVPSPIEPGRHFALDIAVCARPGVPLPDALRVDAVMPEHRHGMNYRAIVVTREAGSYRADGLMFHMPGRWDLIFDLVAAERSERLTAPTRIE